MLFQILSPRSERSARPRAMCVTSALALSLALGVVTSAEAQTSGQGSAQASVAAPVSLSIEPQPLGQALIKLSMQTRRSIYAPAERVANKTARQVSGKLTVTAALDQMLKGTGLSYKVEADGTIVIVEKRVSKPAAAPNRPSAQISGETSAQASAQNDTFMQEVIVTARRKEEKIIDVPVAVSAFTQQQLADLKIEGGAELLRAIPNVNFSKDNFTGYNFSIRGIGTKVLSSTADPAVAVAFNNTALLRNRLFEQEYFDVQRLEVLRGPQGTLYGRNATSGVVNMLPNLPVLSTFSGEAQIEGGNFNSQRARGYVNIPVGDTLAVRLAGAMTKRDGFDYNTVTQKNVNGRDLWSTRVGVLWKPTEAFSANLLWEHFEEDDDRARTGKQLCTRGITPEKLDYRQANGQMTQADIWTLWTRSTLTPGCQSKSLFTDEAYGVADSFGSPMVTGLLWVDPYKASGDASYLVNEYIDPFNTGNGKQSKNLREISTHYDPVFRAKNDLFQLNLEWNLTPGLTLHSQSLYMEDEYFGSQDFLRSQPQSGIFRKVGTKPLREWYDMRRNPYNQTYRFGFNGQDSEFGAIFCDPQLGCADHAQAVDISQSKSEQFSQEIRLQSSFEGKFNFSLGANYLKFKTQEDYYIFSNLLTIIAMRENLNNYTFGTETSAGSDYEDCTTPNHPRLNGCMYIDPNPIDKIDGDGHNYIRNASINKTESWALFGEGYWQIRDNLRFSAGLRYTEDKKTVTPVAGQMLVKYDATDPTSVGKGLYFEPDQVQDWGEFTGKVSLDWKPDISFTDETLIYASYARGYKAGGGNPAVQPIDSKKFSFSPLPRSFAPEYLNAFEAGAKNSFFGNKASLAISAFYYDYKDYQITQLIDRAFHTENLDATALGLEFEGAWRPNRNLRIDATLGLLHTSIANGEKSIDVMNRTADNDDWVVVRPWATSPYTCIVPKDIVGKYLIARGE